MSGAGSALIVTLVLLFSAMIYFAPAYCAWVRGCRTAQVFLICLFLGWTVIGWIVALIMAFGTPTRQR